MKKLMVIICIMFVIVLMVLTNPTKNDYINWLKESSVSQTDDSLEKGLISLIGNPIIDSSTKTKNFILFSVFETNINDDFGINVLGIAHNFIPITHQSRFIIIGFYILILTLATAVVVYLIFPDASKAEMKK